jgi:hypothetical protein
LESSQFRVDSIFIQSGDSTRDNRKEDDYSEYYMHLYLNKKGLQEEIIIQNTFYIDENFNYSIAIN